jgi:hypothetical protein
MMSMEPSIHKGKICNKVDQLNNNKEQKLNLHFLEDIRIDKALKLTYKIGKIEIGFFALEFMYIDDLRSEMFITDNIVDSHEMQS